jgi:hypothetical protein
MPQTLTPFEQFAEGKQQAMAIQKVIMATQELMKQFEEIDVSLDDPSPLIRLQADIQEELSEASLIQITQGLEELFGISA